jgi:phosphodiesterase/alkaline phosphatase D-like protein
MRRFVSALACACAALALLAPAAMADSEPVPSTGNATAISSTSATLNGTVNPEGQSTSYYFEYGTTTSYGSQTATAGAGAGTADVKVSTSLVTLAPNTTYHYRLVATNGSGTALGSDVSFKTPKPPAPVAVARQAANVTQTAATVSGTVDPEGQPTSYAFQYGTSTAYGAQTPSASAGSGTKATVVSTSIAALAPNTTYHYRLAATSVNGTTYSHDLSFKTVALPAGVTVGALPAAITFGQLTSLGGRVLPPRPSHLTVTLQSAPSRGGPWTDAVSTTVASSGAYSFSHLAPASNIYYRVLADGATSATVLVAVHFRVGLHVSRRHPPRGTLVRFHGQVGPGHNGLRLLIQRLGPRGRWHTIRRTRLRLGDFYGVRVRIERSGRYRVIVGPDASHGAGRSPIARISVH